MLIDHIAECFLPPDTALYCVFRIVGRLSGPLMFFFLSEGFLHTRSRLQYGIRLFLFALISQIPYALCFHKGLAVIDLNVGFTLLISFFALLSLEKIEDRFIRFTVVFVLISLSVICDWGVMGPLTALIFYKCRDNKSLRIKAYSVIGAVIILSSFVLFGISGEPWYKEWWHIGTFLVIPLLYFYDGTPGSRAAFHKWSFYIFYPLHLVVICFLQTFL